ncbi:polygalacturonase isoform X2 [Amborella trichopoda]|uniref:polygalacturonase isoform X2 n=1 Tax=Amborella trichopoda TaxID=13333 RepID=UPI0009BE41A4|nr:polygalacturonase isoform X2 [Amborella trichopoda]|eukprot:XP_020519751.1 polygalacturonase isoform X2 [Amborella trichopoda]
MGAFENIIKQLTFTFFVLFYYCSSSYCVFHEDPLPDCLEEDPGYDTSAYPVYYGAILERESESKFDSENFGYEPEFFTTERYDRVGSPEASLKVVSVDDFGAKGDGTDDTQAFAEAWKEACSSAPGILEVPQGNTYLVKPISFSGPCKSAMTVKISGTIEAPSDRDLWIKNGSRHWLLFSHVNNLSVEGGGTINGNGEIWWENSCKIDKSKALTFESCENLIVQELRIKDSQQMHLTFQKCVNVMASNLMVQAPEHSPNTDGIHVTGSKNVVIQNSTIGTGDDCISIVSGSQNIKAVDINCGPGHGISIGSLGAGNSEAHVSAITVDRANLHGTTNGLRIKTWQGGSGNAKNIIFQNVAMHNVSNPIIIDQNYCDSKKPCPEQASAVQISNVIYRNVKGTSATKLAMKFNCSRSYPCERILVQDINLLMESSEPATSYCRNVHGITNGKIIPPACL